MARLLLRVTVASSLIVATEARERAPQTVVSIPHGSASKKDACLLPISPIAGQVGIGPDMSGQPGAPSSAPANGGRGRASRDPGGQSDSTRVPAQKRPLNLHLRLFAEADLWCRRATCDDPFCPSNFPARAPSPTRTLSCYAADLSSDSPSDTSYPARNFTSDASRHPRRPARRTSRSTPCPPCLPFCFRHYSPPQDMCIIQRFHTKSGLPLGGSYHIRAKVRYALSTKAAVEAGQV
jgi:hypothetical protein